ncbi:von Willebrand factor type A domain protein, partial [Vibrio parahaemolyticus V-223/04]
LFLFSTTTETWIASQRTRIILGTTWQQNRIKRSKPILV